jgi:hypothetical protein
MTKGDFERGKVNCGADRPSGYSSYQSVAHRRTIVSRAPDVCGSKSFLLLVIAGLLGSQAAQYLRIESLVYAVALVVAGLYIARHSTEALWVGFSLLAATAQMYPVQIDDAGTSLQGAYRPYILVVVVVTGSLVIGQWFRPKGAYSRRRRQRTGISGSIVAFLSVQILALAYGYFTSARAPGLLDVLRECSGWITFMIFLHLGYRLAPSVAATQRAFARFRLAVLAYSIFFVLKFIYLSLASGADQTAAGFGYSQRDVAFFSGLALVILIAEVLTSEIKSDWRVTWSAALILLLAALLSGSRSVVVCVLIVTSLFVFVWHSKLRLRLGLLGVAVILGVSFGPSLVVPSQQVSQGSLLSYVANRFLTASAEDTSLLARASEMVAVAEAVRENPLLGKGPLASYSFFDPLFGWKDTTFVDSGIGYLLMKTGLLGMGIFIWFSVRWLKMAQGLRRSLPAPTVALLACFVYYLVFLPLGPSFFEFQHSWLIGLVAGQTILLASRFPTLRAAQIPGALDQSAAMA